jgi:hypothetical protein
MLRRDVASVDGLHRVDVIGVRLIKLNIALFHHRVGARCMAEALDMASLVGSDLATIRQDREDAWVRVGEGAVEHNGIVECGGRGVHDGVVLPVRILNRPVVPNVCYRIRIGVCDIGGRVVNGVDTASIGAVVDVGIKRPLDSIPVAKRVVNRDGLVVMGRTQIR